MKGPIFIWCLQQDNVPCNKTPNWFLEHDKFTGLRSADCGDHLSTVKHLWNVVEWEMDIMDVQPTDLLQLSDVIVSV